MREHRYWRKAGTFDHPVTVVRNSQGEDIRISFAKRGGGIPLRHGDTWEQDMHNICTALKTVWILSADRKIVNTEPQKLHGTKYLFLEVSR